MELGKNIIKIRKQNNLTQYDFAEKYFVTRQTVSNWENGTTMSDYSLLKDICNELDTNINELMSGEKIEKENYITKAEENLFLLKKKLDKMCKILNKLTSILSKTILILLIVRISSRYLSIEILNTTFLKNLSYILFFICTIGLVMSFILEVFVYDEDEK